MYKQQKKIFKVIKVYTVTWIISRVYKVACTCTKIVVSYTQKKEGDTSINIIKQRTEKKKSWVDECV